MTKDYTAATPEQIAEFNRLCQEYAEALQRSAQILRDEGFFSPRFGEAEAAVNKAYSRLKAMKKELGFD
jgi:hypothetical protein